MSKHHRENEERYRRELQQRANQVPGLTAELDQLRWASAYLARLLLQGLEAPSGGTYPVGSVELAAHAREFCALNRIDASERVSAFEAERVERETRYCACGRRAFECDGSRAACPPRGVFG